MPKAPSDSDEEDDTAFGGLAPRSGPQPAAPKRRRWGLWAGVVIGLVVVAVFYLVAR